MKRFGYVALMFLLSVFYVGAVSAVEVTIFGPEKYMRTNGKPDSYSDTFPGFEGEGKLVITNGDESGKQRISSAEIEINGALVLGTSDFNQQVARIELPLTLKEENSISVTLKSKPGNFLTVQLVQEVEGSFAVPSDLDKIIMDEGTIYPLNEVLIDLFDDATEQTAKEIASTIGGNVIGYVSSINLFQIKVSVFSKEELQRILDQLRYNPLIENVCRNYVPQLHGITNDLIRLGTNEPDSIDAYEKIGLIEAWNFLYEQQLTFHPVKVGIIDTGVDKNHVEFLGVNFGNSPQSALNDPFEHGTQVAGIIGASNKGGKMNGILSGIPDEPAGNGSKIQYEIEMRLIPNGTDEIANAAKVYALIDELVENHVQVINMSFSFTDERGLGFVQNWPIINNIISCVHGVKAEDFNAMQNIMAAMVNKHNKVVFVVAAGNHNIDIVFSTPGNLSATNKNVISVGATDLNDNRADWDLWVTPWNKSNYGDTIDIAAPGVDVFAPSNFIEPDQNEYDNFLGTSASAPMVTGVAGLLLAIDPSLKPYQIKEVLQKTGDSISTDKPIGKRLNALKAVKSVLEPVSEPSTVSYEFTGHIIDVVTNLPFGFHFNIGDSFSGKLTYDLNRVDQDPDPTIGFYPCLSDSSFNQNNTLSVKINIGNVERSLSTCSEINIQNAPPDRYSDSIYIGTRDKTGGQILRYVDSDLNEVVYSTILLNFYDVATTLNNDSLPSDLDFTNLFLEIYEELYSDCACCYYTNQTAQEYCDLCVQGLGDCPGPAQWFYFYGQIDTLTRLP